MRPTMRTAFAQMLVLTAIWIAVASAQEAPSVFQSDLSRCGPPPSETEGRSLRQNLERLKASARAAELEIQRLDQKKTPVPTTLQNELRKAQVDALRIMQRLECADLLKLNDPVARNVATVPTFVQTEVNFVTDRLKDPEQARINPRNPYLYFTGKLDSDFKDFSYGAIAVTIPTRRKPGELNLPPWWKVVGQGKSDKYFQLRGIAEMTKEALFRDLIVSGADPESSLLIFVHGFNVTFPEAVMRTAQLAHDLSFPGKALLYSWPSGGSIVDYWTDEDSVRISMPRFQHLLADLMSTGISRIYIVAHSMGSRIVIPAVANLREERRDLSKVSEMILAAADFNQIEFKELAQRFAQMRAAGTDTTIYAASNDFALKVSKFVHSYRRLGESDPRLDIYPDLDTIDASATAPMRRAYGHSYVSDSAQVLGDMQDLIVKRLKPQDRGLDPIPNTSSRGWRIPRIP